MSTYYKIMKKLLRQNDWDTTPIKNTLEANKGGSGLEALMEEGGSPIPPGLVEQQSAALDREVEAETFDPSMPLELEKNMGENSLKQIISDMKKKQAPFRKGGLVR